jgi:hypothetical protein
MTIKTEIIRITPSIARLWLEKNTINRQIRRTVVEGYRAALERGEHRITHQGIAFSETGELLDGQHRLTAISEMPETFSLQMMVTRGLPHDAFQAIDIGLKRSHADILNIPTGLAAVARFMATIHDTSRNSITPQRLIPFVEGAQRKYDTLVGFDPTVTKTWSCAAIRTAAILQMLRGSGDDYVCMTYYSLNHLDFDAMPPAGRTLFRQQTRGAVNSHGMDMFCRAFKVFDSKNSSLNKIQITDPSTIISASREIIQERVLGMKKAPTSGAKKVNSVNSNAWA